MHREQKGQVENAKKTKEKTREACRTHQKWGKNPKATNPPKAHWKWVGKKLQKATKPPRLIGNVINPFQPKGRGEKSNQACTTHWKCTENKLSRLERHREQRGQVGNAKKTKEKAREACRTHQKWGSPPKATNPPRPIRYGKKPNKQTNPQRLITAQKHNPPSLKPHCKNT